MARWRERTNWGNAFAEENRRAEDYRRERALERATVHTCAEPPQWRFDPRDVAPAPSSGRPCSGDYVEVLLSGGAWVRMMVCDAASEEFAVSYLGTPRAQRLRFDQEGAAWRWPARP